MTKLELSEVLNKIKKMQEGKYAILITQEDNGAAIYSINLENEGTAEILQKIGSGINLN